MKRVLLLLLLAGCADREAVPLPDRQTIFDIPGADTSYADMRLVGFCVRGEGGQTVGQIVGVTPNGFGGRPGYRIAVEGAKDRTVIGTTGIRDRVVTCV